MVADVEGGSSDGDGKHVQGGTLARRVLAKGAGLAAAFGSGFFSAVQYGVITAGKAYEKRQRCVFCNQLAYCSTRSPRSARIMSGMSSAWPWGRRPSRCM